jgi:hypothetical protein
MRTGWGRASGVVVGLVVAVGLADCSSKQDAATTGAPHDVACATNGGFTACVRACGELDEVETVAASCTDGVYRCPSPHVPAASCPSDSWPSGRFAGCGPWVANYDCATAAVCASGVWTCPASGLDASGS